MNSIEEILAAQQAASDFATSLRSAHMAIALEGRSAPSFIRAAGVLEQASSAINLLMAKLKDVGPDAARYRRFFEAGLPITFRGIEYEDKTSLDAAIDADLAQEKKT